MSQLSDNLGFTLPEENVDRADLNVINDNFELLDEFISSIAPVETSPTKETHNSGSLIIYNGEIYRLSAYKTAGSTLSSSNMTKTSIGKQIGIIEGTLNNVTNYLGTLSSLYGVLGLRLVSFHTVINLDNADALITIPVANVSNAPSGMAGAHTDQMIVLTMKNTSNMAAATYAIQIAFSPIVNNIAIRRKQNSTTWTSWAVK